MDADADSAISHNFCAQCRNKIRMREDVSLMLCTSILEVVAADGKACEHFKESLENCGVAMQCGQQVHGAWRLPTPAPGLPR